MPPASIALVYFGNMYRIGIVGVFSYYLIAPALAHLVDTLLSDLLPWLWRKLRALWHTFWALLRQLRVRLLSLAFTTLLIYLGCGLYPHVIDAWIASYIDPVVAVAARAAADWIDTHARPGAESSTFYNLTYRLVEFANQQHTPL